MNSLRVPVVDATGEVVKSKFIEFLQTFDLDSVDVNDKSCAQHRCCFWKETMKWSMKRRLLGDDCVVEDGDDDDDVNNNNNNKQ